MLNTHILKQQMHVTYYYLFYFNKNGNIILKIISMLENIKCNSELLCHKFLYNYLCRIVSFIIYSIIV
jgi:hypothetical protein